MSRLRRLQTLKVGRDFGVKRIDVSLFQGRLHGWIHILLTVVSQSHAIPCGAEEGNVR